MLNIVIPMAGRGSRFVQAGYTVPKPLIPVHGVPMMQIVCANLRPKCQHRFIFLCLKEHIKDHSIDKRLKAIAPDSTVISIDKVTEGAACTVLLSKELINNDEQLMIANSDQWIDIDINDYLTAMSSGVDGLIMTMKASDPKWSFVRLDEKGKVVEVVEKRVISNEATVGVYNYLRGKDFVDAAERIIAKNIRVNNEFYVAPVYNEMIDQGKKVGIYNIGSDSKGMYGLGMPLDLERFLKDPISLKAAEEARQ